VEDDASLPGDVASLVDLAGVKKVLDVVDEAVLHAGLEDDIVPRGAVDAPPELLGLGPAHVVEDQDFPMKVLGPLAAFQEKGVGGLVGARTRGVRMEDVEELYVAPAGDVNSLIDQEVDVAPMVTPAAEEDVVLDLCVARLEAALRGIVHADDVRADILRGSRGMARLGIIQEVAGLRIGFCDVILRVCVPEEVQGGELGVLLWGVVVQPPEVVGRLMVVGVRVKHCELRYCVLRIQRRCLSR